MRDSIIIIQQEKEDKECYIFRNVICFVLGCILMLSLFLCERAKASEMNDDEIWYYDTFIKSASNYDSAISSSREEYIKQHFNYIIKVDFEYDGYRKVTKYILNFSPTFWNGKAGYLYVGVQPITGSYTSYWSIWLPSDETELRSIGKGGLLLVEIYVGELLTGEKSILRVQDTYWDNASDGTVGNFINQALYRVGDGLDLGYINYKNVRTNSWASYGNFNPTDSITYNEFYCNSDYFYYKNADNSSAVYRASNYLDIAGLRPSQTEGLKVYKQSIHNQEFLMIDFSDCIDWHLVPSGTDIYVSDASFNLNVDGTTELYELDEQYYFTTNRDKEKAYWQIPVSQFNAFGYENANNVYVDNVHIGYGFVSGMPMNYDIYYLSKVFLKGSDDVVDGLEQPDDTSKVEYDDSYIDNSTIINQLNLALGQNGTNNYQYFYFADAYSTPELAYQSIEGVAEVLYIKAQIITDTGAGDEIYFYMGPNTYDKDEYKIDRLFINNEWALYCDVVIFNIYKDYAGPLETADYRYYASVVYYTQRYYIRNGLLNMSYSLKDIVEYSKRTEEYSYLIYSTLYDKLGNMDKNLYTFMISQLTHNSSVENALSNLYGSFDDLNDLIGRIIDILQDLHLEQLDTLDLIDSKLTTIISKIGQSGSGSTGSNDWYQRYRTWLYDTGESTENLIEPHEYFIKAFDDIAGIYNVFDAFNFDSNDTGIYANMKRFIKTMSGDIETLENDVSDFVFFGINSDNYSVYSDVVYEVEGSNE